MPRWGPWNLAGITNSTARWISNPTPTRSRRRSSRSSDAERWGLDAIWLAEIHQQAARSVLSAPLTVAAAIAGAHQPHQDRHRGAGAAAVPSAAAGRGNRHDRPDQPRPAAARRRAQRQSARLCRLRRALCGEPRAFLRDAGNPQAGLDPAELFLCRQVPQLRRGARGAAAVSAAAPADPHRRRQRGHLPAARRARLSAVRRGAQRLAVGVGAGPEGLSRRLRGGRPSRQGRGVSTPVDASRRRPTRRRWKKPSRA